MLANFEVRTVMQKVIPGHNGHFSNEEYNSNELLIKALLRSYFKWNQF